MKNKLFARLGAFMLAVCLLLSLAGVASASEVTGPSATLSLSAVKNGNQVVATVSVTENGGIGSIDFKMSYSGNIEYKSCSSSFEGFTSSANAKNGVVSFGAYSSGEDTTATGTLATFTFDITEKSGTADFALTWGSVGDATFATATPSMSGAPSIDLAEYGNVTTSVTTNGTITVSNNNPAVGSSVTVTATPDAGYEIDKVTADNATLTDNGNGTYTFTMPEGSVNVSATFKAITYNVTASSATNGSVKLSASTATVGTTITVTTTPNEGYEVDNLTVNGEAVSVSGNKATFTMPAKDVTVAATFKLVDYTVTPATVTGGKISVDKTTANMGDTVTVTLTPDNGMKVEKLTVNGTEVTVTNGKATFTMPAKNTTVSATFVGETYKVSMSAATNGKVTAPATAAYNSIVTITLTPNEGYEVDKVTVNGSSSNVSVGGNKATFTMPAEDVTVAATFKAIDYKVTTEAVTGGKISVDKTTANIGDTVTITLTPDTGMKLDKVTVDGTAVTVSGNKATFTMPAKNVKVSATFLGETFKITKGEVKNGKLEVAGSAPYNSTVTVTVTPNEGYKLDKLTVNGTAVTVTNGKATFTMPSKDTTVAATFKAIDYKVTTSASGGKISVDKTTANVGDTITVTLTPDAGMKVEKLTVNGENVKVSGNKATFTMPAKDAKVVANFVGETYKITKAEVKNGKLEVAGTAAYNSEVSMTVTPDKGYKLTSISVKDANGKTVSVSGSGTKYSFKMPDGAVTVSATFEKATYTITVGSVSNGSLSVDKKTAGYGDTITISVSANANYKINYVSATDANGNSVKLNGSNGKYTFTMPDSNVKVTASIVGETYSITAPTVENATINVAGTGEYGSKINFTVTPAEGYKITSVKVLDANGNEVATNGGSGQYSFTMPNSKVSLAVEVEIITYTITAEKTENGTFTLDAETASIGTTVNVTTAPADGYQFNTLTITDAEGKLVTFTGSDNAYSFVMPGSDVTVKVEFEEVPEVTYTTTVAPTQNGTVTLDKTDAGAGSTVTITATPNAGYIVGAVEVTDANGNAVAISGNENVYTFEMPEGNATVKVTFEEDPTIVDSEVEDEPKAEGGFNPLFLILGIAALLIIVAVVIVIIILLKKKKNDEE